MKSTGMSIQKYFLLLLVFLSVVMSVGIIVPGYLQIRDFEWLEAKDYALNRAIGMRDKVDQRVEVLRKAGVSEIPDYIDKSKREIISLFETMEADPRVIRFVIDSSGRKVYGDGGAPSLLIRPSLLRRIDDAEQNYTRYQQDGQNWMTTFQKQDDWGWYILSMMSEREVYLDSQHYLYYVLGVSLLVLLMVLLLSLFLTRHIRQRAATMLGQLERYGEGEYEDRIEVTGPAELGVLQQGINHMIDKIEMEILARRTIEHELNIAKRHAEEINQAKAEYVRDMGDQARSSMNSVLGFSQLLEKTELDVQQKRYVGNVLRATESLNVLVGDMMALSGIEIDGAEEGALQADELEVLQKFLCCLNVLLVGLNPLTCAYVSEILIGHGVSVVSLADESAAIRYLEDEDVDMILLDLDRPDLNREETIGYLRRNLSTYAGGIPLLIMASRVDIQTLKYYQNLGVTSGIAKPFSASRLLKTMSEIIEHEEDG